MNTNRTVLPLLLLSSLLTGGAIGISATQLSQTAGSSVEANGDRLLSQNSGSRGSTCVPGSGRRGCVVSRSTLDV